MKIKTKILFPVMAVAAVLILGASSVLAASVTFSPASVEKNVGGNFSTDVYLNLDSKIYTAKVEINFPADILKVNSFTFAEKWMVLSQEGYDLLDNANGVLIKTAGYPGGTTGTVKVGTISFSSKKEGSGVIKLTSNSLALNAENANILTGALPQISVKINPVVAEPRPAQPTQPAETEQPVEPAQTTEAEDAQPVQLVQTEEVDVSKANEISFMAALGVVLSFGIENIWISLLIWLAVVGALAYLIFKKKKTSSA